MAILLSFKGLRQAYSQMFWLEVAFGCFPWCDQNWLLIASQPCIHSIRCFVSAMHCEQSAKQVLGLIVCITEQLRTAILAVLQLLKHWACWVVQLAHEASDCNTSDEIKQIELADLLCCMQVHSISGGQGYLAAGCGHQ